jgi:predicted aldo/keto reductase-like oxidoreductase
MSQYESRTRLLSRSLQGGYRENVKIAATLPPTLMNSGSDFDRFLDHQLEWLQTDCIDLCLLGWLNRDNWPRLKELGVLPWAEHAMTDGRIDTFGFSCHDDFQGLRIILDDYCGWSFCQFQYSYMDLDHHPGVGGIKFAADRGLAVIAAEPLRGGRLLKTPPPPVAKVWVDGNSQGRSPAEWGMGWVWNHPEVSVVVRNMSSMGQVEDNIAMADNAEPDSFSVRELVFLSHVREAYNKLRPIPCTACRACMPCPLDIDLPRIFEIYNDAVIYSDMEKGRSMYRIEGHDIDACIECDACKKFCAKGLDVMAYLNDARRLLTPKKEDVPS